MTQAQGRWSYGLFWMLEALSYSEGSMDSECYVMIVDTTSEISESVAHRMRTATWKMLDGRTRIRVSNLVHNLLWRHRETAWDTITENNIPKCSIKLSSPVL